MSGLKTCFATASSSWCLNTSRNRWIMALKFPGDAKFLEWFKKAFWVLFFFSPRKRKFNEIHVVGQWVFDLGGCEAG